MKMRAALFSYLKKKKLFVSFPTVRRWSLDEFQVKNRTEQNKNCIPVLACCNSCEKDSQLILLDNKLVCFLIRKCADLWLKNRDYWHVSYRSNRNNQLYLLTLNIMACVILRIHSRRFHFSLSGQTLGFKQEPRKNNFECFIRVFSQRQKPFKKIFLQVKDVGHFLWA